MVNSTPANLILKGLSSSLGADMSAFTLNELFLGYASLANNTTTDVKLATDSKNYVEFIGTNFFTAGSGGALSDFEGTITSIKLVQQNSTTYQFTNLNVSASDLWNAWHTDGSQNGFNLLFANGVSITGTSKADTLIGFDFNDTLNGGSGTDVMKGGNGDDIYLVDNIGDIVDETTGSGNDTIKSSVTISLADGVHVKGSIENLVLTGSSSINATGSGLVDHITGNTGSNIIEGGDGADFLDGGAGTDTLSYKNSSAAINVSLQTGTATGGDAQGDTFSNFENVTGSANDDIIEGNTGSNVLVGGGGHDTLTYANAVSTTTKGVTISLASTSSQSTGISGSDKISGFSDLIGSHFDDVLTGDATANNIWGLEGNDKLDGGAGADHLYGGIGNDTYVVDNAGDVVDETGGNGIDTVLSSVNFSLVETVGQVVGAVENLTLTGSAVINGTGNALANTIIGNGAANTIEGGANADVMDGGGGIDTLSYASSSAAVNVTLNGSQVGSSFGGDSDGDSFKNFENLTGSSHNDTLTGDKGNNIIDGGGGADIMAGHEGNDTYMVDDAGDVVIELQGGGTDTIVASVSYALNDSTSGFVENLTLKSLAGDIAATGNSLANIITGNEGSNVLDGGAGNDTISGGAGNDIIIGGAGADKLTGGTGGDFFVYRLASESSTSASDTITDFVTLADKANNPSLDADKIDLSAIVASGTNLTFTGKAPSTTLGTNSVWYSNSSSTSGGIFGVGGTTTSGPTYVYVDTNGDGQADMKITLGVNKTLVAGDFILNGTPPDAPLGVSLKNDTGDDHSDTITSDATIQISNLALGAHLEYSLDGSNNWLTSFTPLQGDQTIYVRQVSAAGLASGSTSIEFTYDTVAAAPTVALRTDSGSSASDKITNHGTLSVTGTETSATVEYSTDNVHWSSSFTPVEGSNTVYVHQIDVAGNISAATTLTFTYDTTAPNAPTVALLHDTGNSSSDKLTNDGTLNVTTAEAGGTIEYSTDGTTWNSTFTATSGSNTVHVRQVDAAGNTGAVTDFTFNLDTTAPGAPTAGLTTDSGSSQSDGITNDPRLTYALFDSNDTLTFAIGNGAYSSTYVPPSSDGDYVVHVKETDAAGNSTITDVAIHLDSTAPLVPTVALTHDNGSSNTDGYTNDASLTVTKSDSNDTITYAIDSGAYGSSYAAPTTDGDYIVHVKETDKAGNSTIANITIHLDVTAPGTPTVVLADSGVSSSDGITNDASLTVTNYDDADTITYAIGSGNYSSTYTAPTTDGDHTVHVKETDKSGNSATTDVVIHLDKTAPTAPTVTLTHDNGSSSSDGITNDASLTVNASDAVNDTITYAIGNGSYSGTYTAPTTDGDYTVHVKETDKAGNSTVTDFVIHLDTTAPTAPTAALTNDTGSSNSDGYTTDAGLTVTASDGNNDTLSYSIGNSGTWSSTYTAPTTDGDYTVHVKETDKAGNSTIKDVTIHLATTVAAPTVSLVTDSGNSTDKITNVGAVTASGAPGATFEYSADGSTWTSSYTSTTEGINTVLVRQTDLAGNHSTATPFSFTLDTHADAPIVALLHDTGDLATDKLTNDATFNVTGLEQGATVEYSADGLTGWGATYTPTQGNQTVYVHQIDVAGNTSAATGFNFTYDNAAPSTPTVSLFKDTGTYSTDKVTNNSALTLSTDDPNAHYEYSNDGGSTWSRAYTPVEGLHTVQVRAVDVAGNASVGTAFQFTLDTTAPSGPTVALTHDNGSLNSDMITNDGSLTITPSDPNDTILVTPYTLGQGSNTIHAFEIDAAGNISAATDFTFNFDNIAPTASVAVSSVTGDDSVDSTEGSNPIDITGTVGGDVHDGDVVSLTVNGTVYQGAVSSGAYTIQVAGSDVYGATDHEIHASVSTSDLAGNSTTASIDHLYAIV